MNRKLKWIAGSAAAAVVVITGTGIGLAAVADDDANDNDAPITGDALDRASRAALDHTGEGRVTETEVGDEEGYYEVEVTRADGSQVDVHLDRAFKVISGKPDSDSGGDSD